jgi:coproporphyrinogen III oxidase-like Fe-S oxidoreductase
MIMGEDAEFEKIMLALRTEQGLNIEEFNKEFNVNFLEKYKKALAKKGKYLSVDKFVRILEDYLYVQNDIILAFMEE